MLGLLGQCLDPQWYHIYILMLKASYNAKPDSEGMEIYGPLLIVRETERNRYFGGGGVDAYLGRQCVTLRLLKKT